MTKILKVGKIILNEGDNVEFTGFTIDHEHQVRSDKDVAGLMLDAFVMEVRRRMNN